MKFLKAHTGKGNINQLEKSNVNNKPINETELENKIRLENVLNKIRELSRHSEPDWTRAIFYIIKIYADEINCRNNTDLLESEKENRPFEDDTVFYGGFKCSYVKPFRIDLGKSAVITNVWSKDKLTNSLATVSTMDNSFCEDNYRHKYRIYLPIGLTILINGNHSVSASVFKSEGYLEYRPGISSGVVYDLSPLYDKYYFDGTYYRYINNDAVINKTKFEYGCLFEIGRILCENSISYFDYFPETLIE